MTGFQVNAAATPKQQITTATPNARESVEIVVSRPLSDKRDRRKKEQKLPVKGRPKKPLGTWELGSDSLQETHVWRVQANTIRALGLGAKETMMHKENTITRKSSPE